MTDKKFKEITRLQYMRSLLTALLKSGVSLTEKEAYYLGVYNSQVAPKLKELLKETTDAELEAWLDKTNIETLFTKEDEKDMTNTLIGRRLRVKDFFLYITNEDS